MKQTAQLVIIGGGPAGRAVAMAACRRRQVVLVDEAATAGPATLERLMIDSFITAATDGATFAEAQTVASQSRTSYLQKLPEKRKLQAAGVVVITERAELGPGPVVIAGHNQLIARDIVIATGRTMVLPQISGWDRPLGLIDLFSLHGQPKRLAVLGVDHAPEPLLAALRQLGTRLSVIVGETASAELPPEVTRASVATIERLQRSYKVNLQSGATTSQVGADAIVAVGHPQANLIPSLSRVGVQHDQSGIVVNRRFQTSQPTIYAVGACCRSLNHRLGEAEQGNQLGRRLARWF